MGIRFVAEVRHRAADDATLPTAGPLDRQARPESGSDSFSMVQAGNAWKLNEVAHVPGVGTWRRQYRHARKGQRIPGHAMVYVQYGCGSSAPEGWLNFDASLKERLGIRGKCFLARCAMATLYEGCRLRWHRQSCLRVPYSRTPDPSRFRNRVAKHLADTYPRRDTPSHHARSRNRRGCLSATLTKRDVGCQ